MLNACLSGCLPKLKSNEHRVAEPAAKRIKNLFIKILRLLRFRAGTSLSTNRIGKVECSPISAFQLFSVSAFSL
jgi:hypothetical protein